MSDNGNTAATGQAVEIPGKRAPIKVVYFEPLLVSLAICSVVALASYLTVRLSGIATWAAGLIAVLTGALVLVIVFFICSRSANETRGQYLDSLKFARWVRQSLLGVPVLAIGIALGITAVQSLSQIPNLSPPTKQERDEAQEVLKNPKAPLEQRGISNTIIAASGNDPIVVRVEVPTAGPVTLNPASNPTTSNPATDPGQGPGSEGKPRYVYIYTGGGQGHTQTTISTSKSASPGDFGIGGLLFPEMLILRALGFGSSNKSTSTTLQTIQNFATNQPIDQNAVAAELKNLRPSQRKDYTNAILAALEDAAGKRRISSDVVAKARDELDKLTKKVNEEQVAKQTDQKIKTVIGELVKGQDNTVDAIVNAAKPILGPVSPSVLDDLELILMSQEPAAWSKIQPKWDETRQKLLAQ